MRFQPVKDKVLIEHLEHDSLIILPFNHEVYKRAKVLAVSDSVSSVKTNDIIYLMEGVYGYTTDYGKVIKAEWILGRE